MYLLRILKKMYITFEISRQLKQPNRQKLKVKTIEGRAISINEYILLLGCARQVFAYKRHLLTAVFPVFSVFSYFCCNFSRLDSFPPFFLQAVFCRLEVFPFLQSNILKLFLLAVLSGNLIKSPNLFI